ncbi:MAG: HlyD family efflux transporter periplasmic adaptor subunit [Lachnospiraceae bacterium]|nr:HlyD family efflux transporter periplasmic adaptor subunit [Lachnospiraceae bacterium]
MAEAAKKKKKKKFNWVKLIIILAIIGILIYLMASCTAKSAQNAFTKETVERRDIRTYHSFTGTVEPVTEQNVLAEVTGVKVVEVLVEEGDEVKKGEPVAYLDKENIERQIEELELSMSVNEANSDLSIRQARNNYYNYKNDMDNGQNSTIVAAQNQIVSATNAVQTAEQALQIAQRDYQREVAENQAGQTQAILNAKNSVDVAYQQVRQAQITLEERDHAKRISNDDAQYAADASYESAERALDSAWLGYQNALTNLEAAKKKEENTITTYYDKVISAQTAYLNAVDQYNIALHALTMAQTTANESLANYRLQYEQSMQSSDTSVNELKLARLYEQLDDCVVRAPMDGIITTMNIKEGDFIATTNEKPAAVVTDFGEMKVKIKINEYDIMGASVGAPVEITLNAIRKDYVGEISQISRVAKVQNGVSYFDSEVEFKADEDVRSGMSVEVRLIISDEKDVLSIATRNIKIRDDGTAYVNVMGADGKSMEERDVECGISDGTYTEILSGLSEGDTVVRLTFSYEDMAKAMQEEQ